jgi:hypothetical protein
MLRRDPYAAQCFRDVQGARVSRWIRDSEIGWIFYGPGGRAYHLLTDEESARTCSAPWHLLLASPRHSLALWAMT